MWFQFLGPMLTEHWLLSRIHLQCHFELKSKIGKFNSGGGTSSREVAFCLRRPGSNPKTDFGFFQFRIVVNLFSLGVRLFPITCNTVVHTQTLPSSFLIYHCKIYQL